MELYSTGSHPTGVVGSSMCAYRRPAQRPRMCHLECSRIGSQTNPISPVHSQLAAADQSSSTSSACIYRRHYRFCKQSTMDILCQSLSACINDASKWLESTRLLLNPAKKKYSGASLRQICSVRRSLSRHALLILIRALVVSKVDYCISALAGITGHLMDKLQSVLNSPARLVFSARKSEHTTPPLRMHHWLRVPERIQFHLCSLIHHCLHSSALAYLAESKYVS